MWNCCSASRHIAASGHSCASPLCRPSRRAPRAGVGLASPNASPPLPRLPRPCPRTDHLNLNPRPSPPVDQSLHRPPGQCLSTTPQECCYWLRWNQVCLFVLLLHLRLHALLVVALSSLEESRKAALRKDRPICTPLTLHSHTRRNLTTVQAQSWYLELDNTLPSIGSPEYTSCSDCCTCRRGFCS